MTEAHRRRVSALFRRHAQALTLQTGDTPRPFAALFAPTDSGTTATYFDANESVGLQRPALTLYFDAALPDPPQEQDSFLRNGRLWIVRRVQVFFEEETPLLGLAICD